jgi:fructokinase
LRRCPHSLTTPGNAIGVDLGGTKIEAIVLDEHGNSRWRERVATPAGDYDATLQTMVALVARAEADLGWRATHVGVGTPGSATHAGLIKNSNSTCLNGRPLQADLAARLGRPVRIANDANCSRSPKPPTARAQAPRWCSP